MDCGAVSKKTRLATIVRSWQDVPSVMAECLLRRLYWSWPGLRRWWREKTRHKKTVVQECRREDFRAYLKAVGVNSGALVLVHTGINRVHIYSGNSPAKASLLGTAKTLLDELLDLVGQDGTLVMPTHAKYQTSAVERPCASSEILTYDPARSPCDIGLANELFWRREGVKRSLFPFNMLAACGPLADELLRGNLNERIPSPHGPDSGYFRICQRNGLVVSIGVPLREYITMAHVVEEVRADWPIKDFFETRRYRVVQDGATKEWTVRLHREEYVKFCHCRKKMGRDLVGEGVIHEGGVGTVRVDWARAGELYDFFWRKTDKKPYPYYGIFTVRLWKKRS